MVDKLLLIGVVGFNDFLPVGEVEEVVSLVDYFVEVLLRVAAIRHRSAPVILCVYHELVSGPVVLVDVIAVRHAELVIELVSLLRALENVLSLIDRLVGEGVEEAGVPVGGGICGQVGAIDVRAKVQLLEEGVALFGDGGHLGLFLEDKMFDIAA